MRNGLAAALAMFLAACGTTQPPAVAPDASATVAASPAPAAAPASGIQAAIDRIISPTDPVQGIIARIERDGPAKINADMDAAGAYAVSQKDIVAAPCYPAIKVWIAGLPPLPAGALRERIATRAPPIGAATAFEYARVDRIATEGGVNAWRARVQTVLAAGPSPQLMLGCGALLQDERLFIARVAALIGAGATVGAVAPALPMLGPILPVPLP